jgi:hypothetical protein
MSHGQGTQNMRAVNPELPEPPVGEDGGIQPKRTKSRTHDISAAAVEPLGINPGMLYRVDVATRILGVSRNTVLAWATDRTVDPLPILGPGTKTGYVLGSHIIEYMLRAPRHTRTARVKAHKAKTRRRAEGSSTE